MVVQLVRAQVEGPTAHAVAAEAVAQIIPEHTPLVSMLRSTMFSLLHALQLRETALRLHGIVVELLSAISIRAMDWEHVLSLITALPSPAVYGAVCKAQVGVRPLTGDSAHCQ